MISQTLSQEESILKSIGWWADYAPEEGASSVGSRRKGTKMIDQSISHYRVLEKLGEVPNFPTSLRVVGSLSIPACLMELSEAGRPPSLGGSCRRLL